MTNNIATIEQEANEALSEEAKDCYVGEARGRAQAKYAESTLLKTQDA